MKRRPIYQSIPGTPEEPPTPSPALFSNSWNFRKLRRRLLVLGVLAFLTVGIVVTRSSHQKFLHGLGTFISEKAYTTFKPSRQFNNSSYGHKPCPCPANYSPVCCRTLFGAVTTPNSCHCQCRHGSVIYPRPCRGQTQMSGPWQTPSQWPWQKPTQWPWQKPRQEPWQEPTQWPWQKPRQEPWQEPTQWPWQKPTPRPWQMPNQEPGQRYGQRICHCENTFRPVCCKSTSGWTTAANSCKCRCRPGGVVVKYGPCQEYGGPGQRKPCYCHTIYRPVCCKSTSGWTTASNICQCQCRPGGFVTSLGPCLPTPTPEPKKPEPVKPQPEPKRSAPQKPSSQPEPKEPEPEPEPKEPEPQKPSPQPRPKEPEPEPEPQKPSSQPEPKEPEPEPEPKEPEPEPQAPEPEPEPKEPEPEPEPKEPEPEPQAPEPEPEPQAPEPEPEPKGPEPEPEPKEPEPEPEPKGPEPEPQAPEPKPEPKGPEPEPEPKEPEPEPEPKEPEPEPEPKEPEPHPKPQSEPKGHEPKRSHIKHRPCKCPKAPKRVCCGTRHRDYTSRNACFCKCHNKKNIVKHLGPCKRPKLPAPVEPTQNPVCACPSILAPVCCATKHGDVTYDNECVCTCDGNTVKHDGECK